MTRNIILKGRMGELFGEVHRLNVKTVEEGMHAIDTMKGGLRQYLMDCTENGIEFTVQKGEEFLDYSTLGLELNDEDIIISPVPQGADLLKTIVGIALIIGSFFVDAIFPGAGETFRQVAGYLMFATGSMLALQGIIEMMTPEVDDLDEDESTLFNGPINNTKSGVPVPLCYGEMEVGGAVVNFGFTDTRIRGNQGYTFVSKGSSSGGGYGGGGGGGGRGGGGRGAGDYDGIVYDEK